VALAKKLSELVGVSVQLMVKLAEEVIKVKKHAPVVIIK
jgi:hypothetical protein